MRQLHQAHPEKKLIIILDNGPIHRAQQIQNFVKKQSWVSLYYLPPYSPEYNPIERFWKWLKKIVYGAHAYVSVIHIMQVIRLLIWHYNEKWLVNPIQFNVVIYRQLL